MITPRPLKYRVWQDDTMYPVETLCFPPGGIIWYGPGNKTGWVFVNEEFPWTKDHDKPEATDFLMQSIGHKDATDTPIYEGDIVEMPMWHGVDKGYKPEKFTVVWDLKMASFGLLEQSDDKFEKIAGTPDWGRATVIGNIFANPYLLD
jgi:uncharacterized phage protein (TIGR01671 family)